MSAQSPVEIQREDFTIVIKELRSKVVESEREVRVTGGVNRWIFLRECFGTRCMFRVSRLLRLERMVLVELKATAADERKLWDVLTETSKKEKPLFTAFR